MSGKKNKQNKKIKNESIIESVKESQGVSWKLVNYLIYAILVLPTIIFSPWHTSAFELPKTVIVLFLTTWLLVFYLIYKNQAGKWEVTKLQKKVLIIFVVLFSFKLLSFIFSLNKFVSFWGSYTRYEGLVLHFAFTIFFFVLVDFIKSKKQLYNYLLAIAICSGLISFYGVLQKAGIDFSFLKWEEGANIRIASTLGNPLFLGLYTAFTTVLTGFIFFKFEKLWLKILLIVSFIFQVLAMIFTFTSSSFLTIVAVISFIAIFWTWKNKRKLRYFVIFLVLLGTIFVGLLITDVVKIDILQDFSYRTASNLQRVYLWESALHGVAQKPLVGWGNGVFQYAYDYNKNTNLVAPYEMNFDNAHNIYLNELVSEGIFVIFVWFAFLIWSMLIGIKKYFKENDFLFLMASALIFGFCINGITSIPSVSGFIVLFVSLAILFFNEKTENKNFFLMKNKNLLIGILILFGIIVSVVCFMPWRADLKMKQATRMDNWIDKAQMIETAYDLWSHEEYLSELLYAEKQVVDIAQKQEVEFEDVYSQKLLQTLEEYLNKYPNHFLTHITVADYYAFEKNIEKMDESYQHAHELAPKRFQVYWWWAMSYLELENFDKALEKLELALQIDETQPMSYRYLSEYYKLIEDKEKQEYYLEQYKALHKDKFNGVYGL